MARCVTCGAQLSNQWRDLVLDPKHPQCGFCDGTVLDLLVAEGVLPTPKEVS